MKVDRFHNIQSACPLCGGTLLKREFGLRAFDTEFSWDRCNSCSLVFQNPKLTAPARQSFYKESAYFGGSSDSAYDDFTKDDPLRITQSFRRLDLIKSQTGVSSGSMLDIGSASGFFGFAAKQRGFDVTCVEPGTDMCAYGRSNYQLDMREETLETFNPEGRRYDIVTLWGTDSHFDDPVNGFQKIHSMLKPGGILAMNFQDFDHPIRRIFPRIKQSWNCSYNFSDRSFKYLAAELGFSILLSKTEWQVSTLGHVAKLTKIAIPDQLKDITLTLPAVSFKIVLAKQVPPQRSK